MRKHPLLVVWLIANTLPVALPGFSAGPGYDIPTGLGTPDVSKLLKDLSVHESPSLRVDDVARSTNGKHGGHVRLDPRG